LNASQKDIPCDNVNSFNVILHGLFLIEVWGANRPNGERVPDGERIRIFSPKTDNMGIGHLYKAGSWKHQQFTDFSGDSHSNWPEITQQQPSTDGFPTIPHQAGKVDASKSQFSLFLPWPREFNPLRVVNESAVVHTGIEAQWFPLALALRYDAPPADASPIQGCDWSKDNNFHIFAEPPCKLSCPDALQHGPAMVARLLDMFNPPIHFELRQQPGHECDEQPSDPCPQAAGVHPGEDRSYGELFSCTPGTHALSKKSGQLVPPSVHLPLCASIMLTP
jgi:hypothetical protein